MLHPIHIITHSLPVEQGLVTWSDSHAHHPFFHDLKTIWTINLHARYLVSLVVRLSNVAPTATLL
jgi:hypothetical protein